MTRRYLLFDVVNANFQAEDSPDDDGSIPTQRRVPKHSNINLHHSVALPGPSHCAYYLFLMTALDYCFSHWTNNLARQPLLPTPVPTT
jgi:hypothetical protein